MLQFVAQKQRISGSKLTSKALSAWLALSGMCVIVSGCADTRPVVEGPRAIRPPVELSAEVDKAVATTGDKIRFTVTLDREPEIDVEMPEIFSNIHGFKVSNIEHKGPFTRDGRIVQQQIFELRAFEVGSLILPGLQARYTDKKGDVQTVGTPQIFIQIESVLKEGQEQEDIIDIKHVEYPPIAYRRLALLGGGLLLAIGLAIGGIFLMHRRTAAEESAPLPPPPWEVARNELNALEASNLVEKGEVNPFCYSLSEIFRRYLERRFDFPALEETTEEILSAFSRTAVPHGRPQDLARQVLTGTDWVKYAKQIPTADEIDAMLRATRGFIDATVPPPRPEESGAEERKA